MSILSTLARQKKRRPSITTLQAFGPISSQPKNRTALDKDFHVAGSDMSDCAVEQLILEHEAEAMVLRNYSQLLE